jgi:hypothetical protein
LYLNSLVIDVSQPNYLHPSVTSYDPLYLSDEQLRKSWLETTLYNTNDKSLWSVIPQLPSNTHPAGYSTYDPLFLSFLLANSLHSELKGKGRRKSNEPPTITPAPRHEKEKQLFDHIVNYSIDYAVGPLDYCGIAHIRHNQCVFLVLYPQNFTSNGNFRVILCRNDPQVGEYFRDRLEQGIRRRQHLQPGTQKVANPKAFKRKRSDVEAESTHNENQHSTAAPAKVKRTRRSVDKGLVLSFRGNEDLGKHRRSSTKQDEEIIANFEAVSKHLLSFAEPVSKLEGVDHLILLDF